MQRAVVEPCLDGVASVGEADKAMAEMEPLCRKARSDDREQVGAVNGHVRRAVQLLARRIERRPLQGAAVLPAALVGEARTHALAIQPFGKAQPVQDADRVRRHVDAAADLVQLGRLLVDIDLESGAKQRHRGREAADAAADNRDPEGRAQWLFVACQCASASCGLDIAGFMISPCFPVLAVSSMT